MLAKAQFTIMPLYPDITPFSQVLKLISKMKVKITDDNLPNIKANNELNIKETFLFFNNPITAENTIPSRIRKYNIGGIGILVRK